MFDGIKQYWEQLKAGTPGKRFQEQYARNQAEGSRPWRKALFLGGGILIMLAGVFLLAFPGPGWGTIFVGGGLLAQESLHAAKVLDWLELRLRSIVRWALRTWKRSPVWARAIYVLITLALIGAVLYAGYLLFL